MFGSVENIALRESHYKRFFGPLDQPIHHSTNIKPVHIDVYQFAPTRRRPFWTLVTGGMSDAPQYFNDDIPETGALRAELMMYVPKPQNWMFSVLKGLAEYPHDAQTALHWGHTVPNGKPMTAKPSNLTSFLFRSPELEDDGFGSLRIDEEAVDFLWLVPITEEERQFAISVGSGILCDKLDEGLPSHVLDEGRDSVL